MKKLLLLLVIAPFAVILNAQIIADHRVVDLYDDIPQPYLDSVKKMLVFMAGESHSGAYRVGQELLELLDTVYQVETYDGDPPPVDTEGQLRIGRPFMIGESSFFSQSAMDKLKAHITEQNDAGNPYDVMGFGWCWDMTWQNPPGGAMDTVHQVRWAGSSQGGPDGNQRWGLDAGDSALTGNRVCMDTYLRAVEAYNVFCDTGNYPTRWVFTTGPVDGDSNDGTEQGFQREIKHDYIREYVMADTTRILFDYADILCWSDSGEQYVAQWDNGDTVRTHAQIHPHNLMEYDASWNMIPFSDEDEDHIGEVGALRLAKAMWWMLSRMAGWDGTILVSDIEIFPEDSITELMTGDTLHCTAQVLPPVASDPDYSWSLMEESGTGIISGDVQLLGLNPGFVTLVASALDGSGVRDSLRIQVMPPAVPVGGIEILPESGVSELHPGDSLQLRAEIMPDTASNPMFGWSMLTDTDSASISTDGLLVAGTEGLLTVIAGALDGSGVADSFQVSVTARPVAVAHIDLSTTNGASVVVSGDSLQFRAAVLPEDATNKELEWYVLDGNGSGSISRDGLFIAMDTGYVTVVAQAMDGSEVADSFRVSIIAPPPVAVAHIDLSTTNGASAVVSGDSLQFRAAVLPEDATNKELAWYVLDGSGSGSISRDGLFIAMDTGNVTVVAHALDGSEVADSMQIGIFPLVLPVTEITIRTENEESQVEKGSALQFYAEVNPPDATISDIHWMTLSPPGRGYTGEGSIDQNGLFIAENGGKLLIRANARDGSGVIDDFLLTITETVGLDHREKLTPGLWPNPGREQVYLNVTDLQVEQLQIVSSHGRVLRDYQPREGAGVLELDLSGFPAGLYVVLIEAVQGSYSQKLLINK